MDELKQCPFCGDKAILHEKKDSSNQYAWIVECSNQYCISNKLGRNKEFAIMDWNNRQ